MNNIYAGGCLCGKSRYEVHNKPIAGIVCHCRYCQLRSGSPFGNLIYFKKVNFIIKAGELQTYKFYTESGKEWINYFCKNCGTTVYCELEVTKENIGIPGGSFDPPTFFFNINKEVFTRSRAYFVEQIKCDQSFETSKNYNPIKEDADRLKG